MTRPAIQIIRDEHAAVASVLNSMLQVIERAPTPVDERFFDVLRAMLFYIDEFPERRHHPKESELLFPKIDRAVPALRPVLQRLEDDHVQGESRVRALHHLMLAWELLGEGRRQAFQQAAREYVDFYLAHMRIEEVEILPAAQNVLSDADWEELDQAFQNHGDPLAGAARDPEFDPLFARIVTLTPAPFGVGPEL